MTSPRLWSGLLLPHGATPESLGVNFAVLSEHASEVEICFFDSPNPPVFQRRRFFQGRTVHGAQMKELYRLKLDGTEMSDEDFTVQCLGIGLPGDQIAQMSEQGDRIAGEALLFDVHHEPLPSRLGARRRDVRWACIIDTAAPAARQRTFKHLGELPLQARSLGVLRANPADHPSRI